MPGNEGGAGTSNVALCSTFGMTLTGDLPAGACDTMPVPGEVAEWLKAAPC